MFSDNCPSLEALKCTHDMRDETEKKAIRTLDQYLGCCFSTDGFSAVCLSTLMGVVGASAAAAFATACRNFSGQRTSLRTMNELKTEEVQWIRRLKDALNAEQ
jgi:hypothetical protein